MRKILLTFCISVITVVSFAQTYNEVLPKPQSVAPGKGTYTHKAGEVIPIKYNKKIAQEGYLLKITQKGIAIEASTETGVFYAKESLKQMAGGIFKNIETTEWTVDCCTIKDEPRYPYRGLHMDVSRHFRSKEFILKHLDAMAAFKLNRMHWHLTDGSGWRLQIDKYPLLTEVAAWRTIQFNNEWRRADGLFCNEKDGFGGYYSKEDVKEIVEYAQARHITIIPEIEIPGHSSEVLAVYPEFGCTGVPYECHDLCPGKEATFQFIEDVLTEVMEMFPSQYIHIGGDEAGKSKWRTCPDCQKRIKDEGLNNLDELQSYMMKRVEAFLNKHGRKIIGWDEILDGGVSSTATIMSWQTTEGGIRGTELGLDVIMSPQKYCYIDAAQDKPGKEPDAFGVYLPLKTIYNYDPSDGMPNKSHIIGVQANLWSEYVVSDEYAEYMYWPRGLAIAEIGWTDLKNKQGYDEFRTRALKMNGQMADKGYFVFDLANEAGERPEHDRPVDSKALGCKVTYNCEWSKNYPAAREATLTDGLRGGWSFREDRWQGYLCDFDFTIDLGETKSISYFETSFIHLVKEDMWGPAYMEVQVSTDGKNFTTLATFGEKEDPEERKIEIRPVPERLQPKERKAPAEKAPYQHIIKPNKLSEPVTFDVMAKEFAPTDARYIRVFSERGSKGGWHFIDEVIVR